MPFKGTLRRGVQLNIAVTAQPGNAGPTAITLQKILRIPQLQNVQIVEIDVLSTPAGTQTQFTTRLGNNVIRILLAVNPPVGGAVVVTVTQVNTQFEDPIVGDATFVYDIVA